MCLVAQALLKLVQRTKKWVLNDSRSTISGCDPSLTSFEILLIPQFSGLFFCRLQLCSAIHKDPQRPRDTLMINFTVTTILHECRAGWNPCLCTQAMTLQWIWHLCVTRHPGKIVQLLKTSAFKCFCSWMSLFSPCIKHTLCVELAVHNDFLLSVTITEEHFVCEWARLFMRLTIPPKTYHKMFLVGLHMVFVISLCYYLTPYMRNSKLSFPPTTRHQV